MRGLYFVLVGLLPASALAAGNKADDPPPGMKAWSGMDVSLGYSMISRTLTSTTTAPAGAPASANISEVDERATSAVDLNLRLAALGLETGFGGFTGAEGWVTLSVGFAETSTRYQNSAIPSTTTAPQGLLSTGGWGVGLGAALPWTIAHGDEWFVATGLGMGLALGEQPLGGEALQLSLAVRAFARPFGVALRLEYDGGMNGLFAGGAVDHRARVWIGDLLGFRVGGQLVVNTHSTSYTSGTSLVTNTRSSTATGLTLGRAF